MGRVLVIGLDGINPGLIKKWLDSLPNLKKMQQKGIWGDLESTIPPSAPQAWISSLCGRNPGAYGFWDFLYRDNFSYCERKQVNSTVIDDRVNCLYKILPKIGQKVAIIGVPGIWPPPKIPAGYCISNYINQGTENNLTWPENLRDEIKNLIGNYILGVQEASNKEKSLRRIYEMDTQRFTLIKHFIQKKKCDYALCVLMGPKLVSNIFYRYSDSEHRYFDPNSRHRNVLQDYYKWIDKNIGEVMKVLDDDTVLLVHSVYGVQRLNGRININEWLIQNGYMTLKYYPSQPSLFNILSTDCVDWSRTKAWAEGSNGQIFINLKGRESEGIVDHKNYEKLMNKLASEIREIPDENRNSLDIQIFYREELHFGEYSKYGPDMFVNLDKSRWSTNELVGYGKGKIYNFNDTKESFYEGHGFYGYFCLAGSSISSKGEIKGISLLNIAPTIMDILKLEIPPEMEKASMLSILKELDVLTSLDRLKEEKAVRSRLEALGY